MSWRPPALAAAALAAVLALPGPAAADDPPPQVEPRAGTEAPAEVSGLAEPARAGDPVAAAREHLAGPRYRIDPADLVPLHTVVDGGDETVRFAQRHRGLPVLGGQYLVHFRTEVGRRTVTGAGGRYLTELDVATTPAITAELAGRLALARLIPDQATRRTAKAGAGELVVVPRGAGVLAWRLPLTGRDVRRGLPLLRDAYVDAHTGRPLFSVDRLRLAGPAEATGTTAYGERVTLQAYRRDDGAYELRDRSRPMWNGATGEIITYDAKGASVFDVIGPGVPPGLEPARSATPEFGPEHTATGAVDAHHGAGLVYAYYRGLGREGLDGRGGSMHSVVNVTWDGEPFINALWDGTKMIYGGGGTDFHSFAAALDVVGHELTHGVIEHSANLLYLNQSGAMNEGLADYFGNAVEVDTLGVPMTHPDASLLGERLCKTAPPAECATRDLDDGRHATRDYLGVTVGFDAGGVHLNSTIFSGALWDIRERLGGAKADKVVYKALTEYMTPLDDFLDGRRAVESAARAAGLTARDRLVVAAAFDRHGIQRGWDRRIPTDSRVVADNLMTAFAPPALSGDRYVVTDSADDGTGPSYIVTGSLRGGDPVRLSQNDDLNDLPATDGRRGVWASMETGQEGTFRVLSRPLDRRSPETVVHESPALVNTVAVAGDTVVWEGVDPAAGEMELWVKRGAAAPVNVTAETGVEGYQPTIENGKVAYLRVWVEGGHVHTTPAVYDVASGTQVVLPEAPGTGETPSASLRPVVTSGHVVWLTDTDGDGTAGVMRAATDGTGVTALVPDGPDAPMAFWLDAGDTAVTLDVLPGPTLQNRDLPKLFQLPLAGGALERFSCNRGEQFLPAAGDGRRVIWFDGTAGDTDLVTRDRPARRC
ncbi:M4 family metallopeptidase [Nonomuraea sp. MCN248]|uniref:M4 family metallopeptidase n=1 Tax=Nonomuraea corallina TaxID=2989783 RepID=A0ABT4SFA9_9ACTN|nr:M4 family metallopeptidase [Nonomuraea corallina]MDA0635670.1 M4 family metallopeptidase [Nonomuraea corallina]